MFTDVKPDKSKYDLEPDKYIVKLVKLEPCTSQFHPSGQGVKWYFNVAHRPAAPGGDPEPIYSDDGERYELWQFSDPDLTPNSKPGKWAAALLGREIRMGEDGAKLAAEMLDKYAVALIGPNSKNGKTSILSMDPYRPAAKNGSKPETSPPAEKSDNEFAF